VVSKLENVTFHRARNHDIVDQASGSQPTSARALSVEGNRPQMNYMLTQTHTPRMRADRDTKLGGHQQNSENLAHTSEPDGVDLADVNGFGLEELLEDHPVMCMFAGRDANAVRFESLPDGGMA